MVPARLATAHLATAPHRAPVAVRSAVLPLLLIPGMALLLAAWATPAAAQDSKEEPIFQRFRTEMELPNTRQTLLEFPVTVQPQTHRGAKIVENSGLNINRALRPLNRIYVSQGFNFMKLEWEPAEPDLRTVRVIAMDITQQLNLSIRRTFVFGVGVGIGLMDGLIIAPDKTFETRLEPYIPLHLFLGLPLGSSGMVGVKVAQTSFFGPGPVLSVLRGLVGIGYNY